VVQSHPEGLLVSSSPATSSKATPSRGSVFEHEGTLWVNVFEVYKYWFASPLPGAEARWIGTEQVPDVQNIVRSLKRATPVQAERAQLNKGLNSGVLAVDVLAPIGMGQSMLICGPQGAGKSTLAKQVLEQVLAQRHVGKAFRFASELGMGVLADPLLHRAGALQQLASSKTMGESSASLLPVLFDAVGVAEEVRDSGAHALLVLDTLAPLLDAWLLAVNMAEALPDTHQDPEILAAQRRGAFANLLERAANLQKGGSLTMLALLETEALAAVAHAVMATATKEAEPKTFSLEDFKGRRDSELERLRKLQDRNIDITEQSLTALGIAAPGTSQVDGKAARELQSLSDGQVVLDLTKATAEIFPAVEPGATFSRFGLGSTGGAQASTARDVRPPALQAVAAHLRTLLALESEAHFRPSKDGVDLHQTRQMECVAAAMRQTSDAPLLWQEMTALLLAASSGALDALPLEQAKESLSGGSRSPLLIHLREAAPGALQKIATEPQLSQTAIRELEVGIRLYVKLKQADVI